jgi:sugar lactone lactonase YvrE
MPTHPDHLRCVAPVGDRCGEAATWCAEEASLYWCDVNRFLVHRLDLGGAVTSWHFDEPVTALSLTDQDGVILVALASRLILWSPYDDSRRDHGFECAGFPLARMNDGRASPNGDFWIGSMGHNVGQGGEALECPPGLGNLWRIRPGGTASLEKSGIGISNTLCWAPDNRRFYFGDSLANTIWSYDYDPATGAIANEQVFFAGFERGGPDGSAMDSAGRLWNCRFDGGCVVCVSPDGEIDRIVEMPVRNITTCAFGGPDLKTLYITTASMMTHEGDRLAGSLWALEVETPGLDGFRVKL